MPTKATIGAIYLENYKAMIYNEKIKFVNYLIIFMRTSAMPDFLCLLRAAEGT